MGHENFELIQAVQALNYLVWIVIRDFCNQFSRNFQSQHLFQKKDLGQVYCLRSEVRTLVHVVLERTRPKGPRPGPNLRNRCRHIQLSE